MELVRRWRGSGGVRRGDGGGRGRTFPRLPGILPPCSKAARSLRGRSSALGRFLFPWVSGQFPSSTAPRFHMGLCLPGNLATMIALGHGIINTYYVLFEVILNISFIRKELF